VRNYLRSWLAVDLVASFHYTWALALANGVALDDIENDSIQITNPLYKAPRLLRILKVARILRMLKLLRILKVQKLLMRVEEHIVTDIMNLLITLCFLGLKIFFISHWLACFFWSVGVQVLDTS
jgi:hypothetical protein